MKVAETIKTNTLALKFAYNPLLINKVKSLPGGRKWNPKQKWWEVTIDLYNAIKLDQFLKEEEFKVDAKGREILEHNLKEAIEIASKNDKVETELLQVPSNIKATLRPYQVEGFSYQVAKKRAMNGCEMGLGKTLQTIAAIEYQKAHPAVVVCPASLKYNWKAEIEKFTDKSVKVIDSQTLIYSGDADYYIINYDILKKKMDKLTKLQFKSLTFDECHYLKTKSSQRTRAAKELSKLTNIVYMLTGTTVENRPVEITSQMEILGVLNEQFGGYWKFVNRYCNVKRTRFGLDVNGASHIDELIIRMKRSFYFRKNKKEVLKDLPDKVYIDYPVEINNFDEYQNAENNLVNFLTEKKFRDADFRKTLAGLSKEEQQKAVQDYRNEVAVKSAAAEHLVLINALRQVTAEGKIEKAKEFINTFLEESTDKILVFAHHTNVVKQLAQEFKCKAIYGGVSSEERMNIVNDFQNNPETRVLVLNIKAGGVGLNLTAASTVLFVEEPWNPALKWQAEDRAHRIGQKNSVNIYTMYAVGTIDVDVFELLKEKAKVVQAVNSGQIMEDSDDSSVLKEIMKKFNKLV